MRHVTESCDQPEWRDLRDCWYWCSC